MSRPLKFRAWDRYHKTMVYPAKDQYLFSVEYGELYMVLAGECESTDPQDYEIMQFTGLLDSEGVEIYESDVLEKNGKKYLCDWDDVICGFVFEIIGDKGNWINPYETHMFAVIGNVHEHPHLVEGALA